MNITEIESVLGRPRGASPVKDWTCWGDNAWYVDWGTEASHLASVIVNSDTAEILCFELFSLDESFRWIQSEFVADFRKECEGRDIDSSDSGQGPWQDIKEPDTILVIAGKITGEL